METSGGASSLRVRLSIVLELGFIVDNELEDFVSLDMYFNKGMNVIEFDLASMKSLKIFFFSN